MILTSLSALNLCQHCEEEFTIQAGEHQSIDLTFIYIEPFCSDFKDYSLDLVITDVDSKIKIDCFYEVYNKKYKSKWIEIDIQIQNNRLPYGFRIHYKMSNHSFQRYSTYSSTFVGKDNNPNKISACSMVFRKCYTVFDGRDSWDSANRHCNNGNEHLVTIASRKEMNYVQYLLRSLAFRISYINISDADNPYWNGAHIGNFFT
ncbi:uncharacterized protein LOC132725148 [Ruditapes philippinarum]|uniref:uncharacterized protein LOC132725148 n=1 Tax=Ruditapes philippinarum TaxID=129788 RepID=UPI00295BA260|nr:uncharacterized protein LOC132725148 [Ruditapes philippinarum]